MNSPAGIARLASAILLASATALTAADLAFVAVLKGQQYRQTDPAWSMLGELGNADDGGERFYWETFAVGTDAGRLVSGTVTLPGGTVMTLEPDPWGDEELAAMTGAVTPRELDLAHPDGDHVVSVTTRSEGVKAFVLTLDSSSWPPAPRIANFSALQAIDPAFPIQVSWDPMGGTTNDYVRLEIEDTQSGETVFETAGPGQPGSLDGTIGGVQVPAGTLLPGHRYEAELIFVKVTDLEVGLTFGVAGTYKALGFPMKTLTPAGMSYAASIMNVAPGDGAGGVARDSTVAFRFTAPMTPGSGTVSWSVGGQPWSSANFTATWVNNNTQLQFRPVGLLPAQAEIAWSLDLSGFRDANGFPPVGGPTSGRFWTSDEDTTGDPDVDFVSAVKWREHVQVGDAPVPTGLWGAEVDVEMPAYGRARSATLATLANARTGPLFPDRWDAEYYRTGDYGSKDDLDRNFPNGSWSIVVNTRDEGTRTVPLDLGTTDAYPDAPRVTNLAALQGVDAGAPVTITWEELPGRVGAIVPGGGWIGLGIATQSGNEILWVEDDELTSGTSFTIPAGTLGRGKAYVAELSFVRVTDVDTTASPGAFAVAGFEAITTFEITTGGTPGLPRLEVHTVGAWLGIEVALGEAEPAHHVVEASQDLGRWAPFADFWLDGQGWRNDDNDAQYLPRRFYRVREVLPDENLTPPVTIQGVVVHAAMPWVPVAGAIVGTTLDARTTVTDAQGRFFLETDNRQPSGPGIYVITVRVGATLREHGPWDWGHHPRGQVFQFP